MPKEDAWERRGFAEDEDLINSGERIIEIVRIPYLGARQVYPIRMRASPVLGKSSRYVACIP